MSAEMRFLIDLVKELTEKLEEQQKVINRIESLVDELDNRL